jgi:F-type H+-transporting ATPase subunit a
LLEHLGKELALHIRIGGVEIAFNLAVIAAAVGVTIALALVALWLRRGLSADPDAPPSRRAAALAAAVELVEDQLLGGFTKSLRRRLLPLIATLLLYVLLCNWASLLPIPYVVSPTQDLNVTMGLALMVYGLTHYYGIREKGFFRHLRGYFEPFPFLLPLNVVGDFGRTLSHGFRLFGNILGGAILTTIVTEKFAPVLVPVVLNGWFGLFAGTIQAFVFALLASAYIQVTAE